MRAARYHPSSSSVQIDTIPIPTINDNELLVKIKSASLCHSDLMLFDGSIAATEPVTMGHEGVGYVKAMGHNVMGFEEGQASIVECEGCLVHNLNCTNGSPVIQGFGADGFFAEYAAVDYRNAMELPSSLEIEDAALYFCGGITAFHGIDSCDLKPGQWVAVIGCGGLGQTGILCAKALGLKVVGVDINEDALEAAEASGADLVLSSRSADCEAELRAATNGGADAAVVFSAAQAAYDTATRSVRLGGTVMVIGLPSRPIQFSGIDLMKKLYVIKSESTGPPQQMPRAMDFIAKNQIRPYVEHYTLDDIHHMIDLMDKGLSKSRMAVVFD